MLKKSLAEARVWGFTHFQALSDQNMKNELRHNESLALKAFSSLL
ncbi:hypothetical protein MICAF_4220005 [Microcystis aeruginosa PCC 9807]|uniref:Uncharacterized protein n=1 Tax=Microcystis aeruginosa PCC 9807 TaxID=1160283 RepID=I4H9B1_MICAE|nr:hypothetical protein MICAF_4220005 [Microcystis aeruginosa PCC 9807]